MPGGWSGGRPLLQVERLSLVYPRRRTQPAVTILNDVSVQVERGGVLMLVGASGSGKSSLLRCLNRLEEPTSGTVSFDGHSITELDPRELRRRAAFVRQTPVMFEGTVRDNLLVRPADVALDDSAACLRATLNEVGLDGDLLSRDAASLSGGEKQRVAIARALLRNPQALLLDEPTSALDPPNTAVVVDAIARLCRARCLTLVAVTHSPELVHRLGGALIYLTKGRVEAYERVDDGVGGITHPRLRSFLAADLPRSPSP